MFDELKNIKSKLKAQEPKETSSKPKKAKSKEAILSEKENELRADFLDYMKDVKRI